MKDVKIRLKKTETDIVCEKCGRKMVVKFGRYGKFIACPGYPDCQNIKSLYSRRLAFARNAAKKIVARKSKEGACFLRM